MALITCPDCGKQISDQAPVCPECGRPSNQQPPQPSGRRASSKLTCPSCGGIHLSKNQRGGMTHLTCLTCGLVWAPEFIRRQITGQLADRPPKKSRLPLLLLILLGAIIFAAIWAAAVGSN